MGFGAKAPAPPQAPPPAPTPAALTPAPKFPTTPRMGGTFLTSAIGEMKTDALSKGRKTLLGQ